MNIERLSRFLKIVCIFAALAKPIWVAAYWITNGFAGMNFGPLQSEWHPIPLGVSLVPLSELNPLLKCAGFVVDLALTAFTSLAFWLGYELFRRFQSGTIFTLSSSRLIHKIGLLLLLQQCFYPIYSMLYSLIITISNPPGERLISISVGNAQLELVLFALILIVGSRIMAKAHELQEETEATV